MHQSLTLNDSTGAAAPVIPAVGILEFITWINRKVLTLISKAAAVGA